MIPRLLMMIASPHTDDINKYIMKGYRAKIPPGIYPNARPIALVEFKAIEDAYHCVTSAAGTSFALLRTYVIISPLLISVIGAEVFN